jgi:DNA-binding NarL/FixJ family response regulator
MNLTEREKTILRLSKQGLSDYKIARKIKTDPPSVTRSRKNAGKKLILAVKDLQWAIQTEVNIKIDQNLTEQTNIHYNFYL